ncbi:hypothetical protein SAMN02745216_04423 [Desulfatibacillum alkenivorans DSM 16219]|jgi:hypothetical protein|uniref:Uncharacterized protein n=1 Tax=Desulfatibacillum alkenivorans DSM 16219 TaxID=1121393 RepID=A0A1M6WYJ4_9BACT|nr:hypothetical protein [Desulfatibacillum alkenivorans]SHK98635.1 hypothetical protein SAMN02745216_04423 [Desulfatibacillum alkenivorans DSM 16219]
MPHFDQSTENVREAFSRAFPSPKDFRNFKENDLKVSPGALAKILEIADSQDFLVSDYPDIPMNKEAAFQRFLAREGAERERRRGEPMPSDLGFAGFLRILWDHTGVGSASALVENLNEIAKKLGMAPVQESMVSRLKSHFNLNTPKKRNFIRLLCFWIGLRAARVLPWDYNTFLALPLDETVPAPVPETEGVRLSLIASDKRMMEWLHKELAESLKYLRFHHLDPRKAVRFERIISLDIPKLPGPSREPRLFGKAVTEALSLSHQATVRWLLSDYHEPDVRLGVLISAGNFDSMETSVKLLSAASSFVGAGILVNDFGRLCARMAEVKVVFGRQPGGVDVQGGTDQLWEVEGFWPSFFKLVPQLHEPDVIPRKREYFQSFQEALYTADHAKAPSFRALTAIKRYPQNSFVILEIFKALFLRRMFQEANEVLSTLLAAEPANIIARSMRISSCFYLGMRHAAQPSLSDLFFDRALREAEFVENRCIIDDEEFYGKVGRIHLARALRDLSSLWEGNGRERLCLEDVTGSLKKCLACYEKGVVASPTGKGAQSIFWMIHVKSLLEILEKNPAPPPDGVLMDEQGIYLKNAWDLFSFHGWVDPEDGRFLMHRVQPLVASYGTASQLASITPYSLYSVAAFQHDMAPVLSVGGVKLALAYIDEAEKAAARVPRFMGLYSIGGCLCLIQSLEEFLECCGASRQAILKKYKDYLEGARDEQVIPWKDRMGLRLCLINLNRRPGADVLFWEEDEEE